MKRALWFSLLCLSCAPAMAGEHPEHPMGKASAPKKEHPAHEHPVGSKPWIKHMNKEYVRAVEEHAKAAGKEGLAVRDEVLNKDWRLKLLRVHKDRIAYLGDNRFFACADLKSVKKDDPGQLDLDFYAVKGPSGWTVEKTLVHKVDGKPRYTYNEKNEIVPVK